MTITIKDFDMKIDDKAVETNTEIIRDILLQIKSMLDDHDSRIETLEP